MAMTIGALLDRLVALALAQGYTPARTPFDFDRQPSQNLDKTFTLQLDRVRTDGLTGGDQIEVYRATFYLAQRVKADGWGAQRSLSVDVSLLEASVLADYPAYDFSVVDDSARSDVRQPGADADYAIGRLQVDVEIDRDLT